MSEVNSEVTMTEITLDAIRARLAEKVSGYNAKLLLNDAIVSSGVQTDFRTPLDSEMAKSICLALLAKGGPSFQVGKSLYKTIH